MKSDSSKECWVLTALRKGQGGSSCICLNIDAGWVGNWKWKSKNMPHCDTRCRERNYLGGAPHCATKPRNSWGTSWLEERNNEAFFRTNSHQLQIPISAFQIPGWNFINCNQNSLYCCAFKGLFTVKGLRPAFCNDHGLGSLLRPGWSLQEMWGSISGKQEVS